MTLASKNILFFFFFFSFDRKTISIVEGGVGLIAAGNNARGELIVWFYSYGEMKSEITNKLAPIRLFITAVIVAAKQSIVSSGEHPMVSIKLIVRSDPPVARWNKLKPSSRNEPAPRWNFPSSLVSLLERIIREPSPFYHYLKRANFTLHRFARWKYSKYLISGQYLSFE